MSDINFEKAAQDASAAMSGKPTTTPALEVEGALAAATTTYMIALFASYGVSILRGVVGGSLVALALTSYIAHGTLSVGQWIALVIGAALVLVDIDRKFLRPVSKNFLAELKTSTAHQKAAKAAGLPAYQPGTLGAICLGLLGSAVVFATVAAAVIIFSVTFFHALQPNGFTFSRITWLCVTGLWITDGIQTFALGHLEKREAARAKA